MNALFFKTVSRRLTHLKIIKQSGKFLFHTSEFQNGKQDECPSDDKCEADPPPRNKICELKEPELFSHPPPKPWVTKAIFITIFLPIIIFLTINNIVYPDPIERPPFVPYTYMRMRTKRFPWGEGNKTAFHNPHMNALPEGYEDELEGGDE